MVYSVSSTINPISGVVSKDTNIPNSLLSQSEEVSSLTPRLSQGIQSLHRPTHSIDMSYIKEPLDDVLVQVPKNFSYPEIDKAHFVFNENSTLAPSEIADKVCISGKQLETVQWMENDLKNYDKNFEEVFSLKLKRITEHERMQLNALDESVQELKSKHHHGLISESELQFQVDNLKKQFRVFGFKAQYKSTDEFIRRFVGPEKGKLLKKTPSLNSLNLMDKIKDIETLYVDTWSVPFFNTATQSKSQAHQGIKNALSHFKQALEKPNITIYKFYRLIALFARPEFDDIRRYKLQIFPTVHEFNRFAGEINDAAYLGDLFPQQAFVPTHENLGLTKLTQLFGQNIHLLGISSHFKSNLFADGRIFSGTADFLEHDQFHAWLALHPKVPGTPEQWQNIHEKFKELQNQESNKTQKWLNRLVYFQITHESGYAKLLPNWKGEPPVESDFDNLIHELIARIHTKNDFDWIKSENVVGPNFEAPLKIAFDKVSEFFKTELKKIIS